MYVAAVSFDSVLLLSPRKPEGSLGRTAQDGHLDSHTAPELWAKGLDSWAKISSSVVWTKVHAVIYDILPDSRKVPERDVGVWVWTCRGRSWQKKLPLLRIRGKVVLPGGSIGGCCVTTDLDSSVT